MAPNLTNIVGIGERDKREKALLTAADRAIQTVLETPRYNGLSAIVHSVLFEDPGKDGIDVAKGVKITEKRAYFVVQVNRADENTDYVAVGIDQDNMLVCVPCSLKVRDSLEGHTLDVTWNLEDPKKLTYEESDEVSDYDDKRFVSSSPVLTFKSFTAICEDPIQLSRAYTWLDITYDTALFD